MSLSRDNFHTADPDTFGGKKKKKVEGKVAQGTEKVKEK